jgi:serine/threonine protein kinase
VSSTESLKFRIESAQRRVGETVKGKWKLDGVLGVGGMAAVYSATHRNGKRVAIKVLHAELVANRDLVARFVREGYVANKVKHPGAVSIVDDDRMEDGSVFLVMEHLEGHSLDRYSRPQGQRLDTKRILELSAEVLDVLSAAHSHGIIHRDVKPGNLFLLNDGHVKVLDFGIARLVEPASGTVTQTGTAIGSPAYMPPEQARGRWKLIDGRSDLWALGATMFHLLSGVRPRRAPTSNEELLLAMTSPIRPLAPRAPHLEPSIVALVERALAFDMDARWPDARSMQAVIQEILARGVAETKAPVAPSVAFANDETESELPETKDARKDDADREAHLTTARGVTSAIPYSWASPSKALLWAALAVVVVGVASLGVWRLRATDGTSAVADRPPTQTPGVASPRSAEQAAVPPLPVMVPLPAPTASSPVEEEAAAATSARVRRSGHLQSAEAAAPGRAQPPPLPSMAPSSTPPVKRDPFDSRFSP